MIVVPGSLTATPYMVNMGPTEILLVLLVLVLLFGAKKLPELARGSGRALRIFKSETRGLLDDEPADTTRNADTTMPGRTAALPTARHTEHEAEILPAVDHSRERS
jgi:sec-independent protein translocase protein TatA